MHWSVLLILSITLLIIFFQDLERRSVVWILFPLVAATGIVNYMMHADARRLFFQNTGFNLAFVLLLLLVLKFYFMLKKTPNLRQQIGSGDVVFWVACTCIFSPLNFLLYYILSLIFTLVAHLLTINISPKQKKLGTIALAGWQSFYLLLLAYVYEFFDVSLNDDFWILVHLQTP